MHEQTSPESEVTSARQIVLESLQSESAEELVNDFIIDRLTVLESHSRFNNDSRDIERAVNKVLDALTAELRSEGVELSPEDVHEARIAALIHDIGKSGPAEASEEQSIAITKLFAVDKWVPETTTLSEHVSNSFPGQEEWFHNQLSILGLDPQMTMRQFWDLHAYWTKDILEKTHTQLKPSIKVMAASHHSYRGINPYELSKEKIPAASSALGFGEEYIELIKGRALIAMDIYQAISKRPPKPNQKPPIEEFKQAMSRLYGTDAIMDKIVHTLVELEQSGSIF